MPIILILIQEANNESVKILTEALLRAAKNENKDYKILVWEINNIQTARICGDSLRLLTRDQLQQTFISSNGIPLCDIALVIKRTWGPIRDEVLQICRELENHRIKILNGCDFISWSHSKIKQYDSLSDTGLFPPSICFSPKEIESFLPEEFEKKIASLHFPIIFKTAKGTRTDGVYLVESLTMLQQKIKEFISTGKYKILDGFLLQHFIQTAPDISLSNYYRINIVNGLAQSAVQFQLRWELTTNLGIKKLMDFKEADDTPVSLDLFDAKQLHRVVDACPTSGVVGADVLWLENDQKLYLLEYNDGPVISLIVKLGKSLQSTAHTQCAIFGETIATCCMQKAILSCSSAIKAKL